MLTRSSYMEKYFEAVCSTECT